jgi:hypothetical protein
VAGSGERCRVRSTATELDNIGRRLEDGASSEDEEITEWPDCWRSIHAMSGHETGDIEETIPIAVWLLRGGKDSARQVHLVVIGKELSGSQTALGHFGANNLGP